jgi:hypothetical protein
MAMWPQHAAVQRRASFIRTDTGQLPLFSSFYVSLFFFSFSFFSPKSRMSLNVGVGEPREAQRGEAASSAQLN